MIKISSPFLGNSSLHPVRLRISIFVFLLQYLLNLVHEYAHRLCP